MSKYIEYQPLISPATARGDPMPATTIAITETLYNALVFLRCEEEERILWVDQICINQGDLDERSV